MLEHGDWRYVRNWIGIRLAQKDHLECRRSQDMPVDGVATITTLNHITGAAFCGHWSPGVVQDWDLWVVSHLVSPVDRRDLTPCAPDSGRTEGRGMPPVGLQRRWFIVCLNCGSVLPTSTRLIDARPVAPVVHMVCQDGTGFISLIRPRWTNSKSPG